jgi:hypothetical protein
MTLMIVNDEVEQLAHELARQTGEPIPRIILEALRERARRIQTPRAEVQAIARIRRARQSCARLPDRNTDSVDAILGYGPDGTFDLW